MFNKKVLLSAIVSGIAGMFLAANASASVSGPYLGLQVGAGNVHQNIFGDDSSYGVAGRVLGGYQFNQNVAIEAGITKYSDAKNSINDFFVGKINGKIETFTVDLAAKGIIPLQSGFSLYGKLGGVYVDEKATASIPSVSFSNSDTEHKVFPEVAVGVSYDINQNVVADISWTHVQKVGDNSDLGNLDFGAVGLSYYFG